MRTPAFNVKFPFSIVAPVMVVAPVPANVAEPPTFVVKVEEKPYATELLNVTSEAVTTGPVKVIGLVPETVWVLVENVIVPVPGAVIVPLLVRPPLNSSGAFPVFVNVPALVNSPVKMFVPVTLASLKVALFVNVDNAVKFPEPSVKVPPLVIAPEAVNAPAPAVRAPLFVITPATVKVPAPAVTVPLFVMVPFAMMFPAPPESVPPRLIVVLGIVRENVLFASVIGEGIVSALFTVVFPPNVFVLVPLNTKLL